VVTDPTPATPTITPGGPTTFCNGGSVTLTASASTGIQWYLNQAPIGGANSITYIATASGNYTATLSSGGCTTPESNVITVTVNPIPEAPVASAGGPTTFCAGGSVTLNSSAASGNQWYLNGGAIGGATGTSYIANASGNYTVRTTDGNNCTSPDSNTISVTVNPLPATPTITPGGPTTFCAGGSVTLTSSSATGNQWNLNGNPIGGQTGTSYNATASGNYTVTVTDGNNCSATSAVTTVTVNPIPATPTITPGGPTTFCTGGSVTLTSSSASGNQWYLNGNPIGGATAQQYIANASGNYTVIVTASGCSSAASAATSVTVNPTPATPTITGNSSFCTGGSTTLTSSSASGNQWYVNGNPIGGATSNTYVATTAGDYTVVVTASGCSSAPSAVKTVTVNPNPNATITAPSSVQAGSTGNAASVANAGAGATYAWGITNGTITGGTGTSAITFTAGAVGTLTLNVTVTTGAGCSAPGTTNVTVTAAPPSVTITSVVPPNGPYFGGQPVTINGTGFNAGATVTFGGNAATNVVVVSSIKITAKTPAHAPGAVNVTVTNTNASTATATNAYTYRPQQFDPNNDGVIDPSDIFYLVNYLYLNGPAPAGAVGMLSGDSNGDGIIDPSDIFYLVNYLFGTGPRPEVKRGGGATEALTARLTGSITLGQPLLRNDRMVVPVILTAAPGSVAPQAMSLAVRMEGSADATIHRAGAAAGLQPMFEVSRASDDALAYLIMFDQQTPLLLGANGSAVVAEIELSSQAAGRLEIDAARTLLSNAGGTQSATVGNRMLTVRGLTLDSTRSPKQDSKGTNAQ